MTWNVLTLLSILAMFIIGTCQVHLQTEAWKAMKEACRARTANTYEAP